jgi:hypothetical protein
MSELAEDPSGEPSPEGSGEGSGTECPHQLSAPPGIVCPSMRRQAIGLARNQVAQVGAGMLPIGRPRPHTSPPGAIRGMGMSEQPRQVMTGIVEVATRQLQGELRSHLWVHRVPSPHLRASHGVMESLAHSAL